MQTPPQISFLHMGHSDAIEAACRAEAHKLERYCDTITHCRIVVSEPNKRHRSGNLIDIRVAVAIPGGEVVVNREPPAHHQDEDAYVAIREAFDTTRRRLEDFVRRQRGDVKHHVPRPETKP